MYMRYRILLCTIAGVFLLAGCATTGNRPLTANQKIASCVGMVVGGALLGNLIGKDSNATIKGAAVGGATCAVWLAFNNAADKRRMEEARQRALISGEMQEDHWQNDSGESRMVKVELGSEAATQMPGVICRPVRTVVGAGGQTASMDEEWCRLPDGSYHPRSEVMA